MSIEDSDGVIHYGHNEVKQIAVEHFSTFLGSPSPAHLHDFQDLASHFSGTLSPQAALSLDREVTDAEVLSSLKSMKQNKSPGPDGFNVNFFLHAWDIVGTDFTLAIKSFFHRGCLLRGTNSTAIALVPKIPNPSSMSDYRPISCCNTTYKCISKIIAARLKGVLPNLISPCQAAFVPGRKIGDNILVAQELFRNYHRPSGPARCALKIDLSKAFDSISWDFLFEALRLFKFPPKFLFWIKACISTTQFSVKVNGALCGYFPGAKGLRQGDPLSPYLFVLVMEVLSAIISKETKQTTFKYHWKTKQLNLTHLCFADDLILFCHGDIHSVSVLKLCLDQFSLMSGLRINPSKSMCFLAHVPSDITTSIISCLGFQLGSFPAKFLGVPLITSKLSLADCQPLLEKIRGRITSWTTKFLSYAGRLQLVKSVIHAIQAYWSAHFILPSAVLKDIKLIMSRFLWKGSSLQKSGAKVAWRKITLPFDEGGLAIKHLDDWNQSLILMHLWQIITPTSSSLWAAWVKSFTLKDRPFWCIPVPNDCSWIWRKVLKLRSLAARHINYRIGNGSSISLWFDPWLSSSPLASSATSLLITNSGLSSTAKVSSIIHNSSWSLPISNHSAVIDFRSSFDYTKQCNSLSPDIILWDNSPSDMVKAVTVWHSIRQQGQKVAWHNLVWHKFLPPRFSFNLWLAFHGGLRTLDKLLTFGIVVNPTCVLCNSAPENFNHLFFQCSFSFQMFLSVLRHCGWRGFSRRWSSITNFISSCSSTKAHHGILRLGFAAVVYSIWRERNARIHSKIATPAKTIVHDILHLLKCSLLSNIRFQRVINRPWFSHLIL